MKILPTLILILYGQAMPLAMAMEVKLVNNTPLFEDYGCHRYAGAESIRAVLQLIASAQMDITIASPDASNEAVQELITRKRNMGVSIKQYEAPMGTPTYIKIDYAFLGIGSISLGHTMYSNGGINVCRSGGESKAAMETSFNKILAKSKIYGN